MKHSLLLISLLMAEAMSACNTLPADPSKMSAEQLKAWAADKNANVACSTFKGMYGTGVVNYAVIDKGILVDGTVTVDNECKITISNSVPEKISPVK